MGIISDTFEDNREKGFEVVDGLIVGGYKGGSHEEGPPLIECQLCGSKAASDEDLKYHINEFHANRYVYLRANNVVVYDYAYIEEDLKSLDVVLLGYKNARLKLKINDNDPKEFNFSKGASLSRFLKGFESGEIRLKVTFQSGEREFVLYCGGLYKFESSEVEKAAFQNLFLPLDSRKNPDYRTFTKNYLHTNGKKPEYRYASSFYEYALGFEMSARGDNNAKEHFESAFFGLYPFKTNFAITARRVLALRMNCFKFLEGCEFPSRFALANFFFNKPEARFDLPKKYTISNDISEYGVYIDDFTKLFIDALSAYYDYDFKILEAIFEELSKSINENDKNNRDKLILLEARGARKRGDYENSKKHYQDLLYHPFFKDEAMEMIKGDL